MVAEIVEAFQVRTGRRAEGSFYSGNWFVQKCATGVGIFLAGMMIKLSGMPDNATPGAVADAVLDNLTIYYIAASIGLAVFSAYWLRRFPITRDDHEATLKTLDAAARGNIDAGGVVP